MSTPIGQSLARQATTQMYPPSGPTPTIEQQDDYGQKGLYAINNQGDDSEKMVTEAAINARNDIYSAQDGEATTQQAWAAQDMEKAALNHLAAGLQDGYLATIAFHAMRNIEADATSHPQLGSPLRDEIRVGQRFAEEMVNYQPELATAAAQAKQAASDKLTANDVQGARDVLYNFFDQNRTDKTT